MPVSIVTDKNNGSSHQALTLQILGKFYHGHKPLPDKAVNIKIVQTPL